MKSICIAMALCFAMVNTFAQNVELTNDTIHITIKGHGSDPDAVQQVRLKFRLWGSAPAATTITLSAIQAGGAVQAEVVNPTITFTQAEFVANTNTTVYRDIPIKLLDQQVPDFQIQESQNLSTVYIKADGKKKEPADTTKIFWVEIGSNFDLLDGLQANNLYTGVYFYKREIGFPNKHGVVKGTRFAAAAGVYESKSTSQESTAQLSPLQYFDPTKMIRPVTAPDSFFTYIDTGKISATTVVSSTGLFFSPQFRLTNGDANAEGFHVFASFWMEMVWQRYKTTYDFTGAKLYDSIKVQLTKTIVDTIGTKPQDITRDVRSHYIGIGLPVYTKFGDVSLFVNSVVGYSNQMLALSALRPTTQGKTVFLNTTKSGTADLMALTTPKKEWNPFYLFQFRLNEEKYGISFTGEIRGLMVLNTKPVISLALSKKFDLSKLVEYK